jgi:hypothetical protein
MNNTTNFNFNFFYYLLQSSYDKLFYWKDNVEWKGHFANTPLKKSATSFAQHSR